MSGRLRGTARAGNARGHTESADYPHVRRYLKPTVTPLPPLLNEFSLPAKCELMIRSLSLPPLQTRFDYFTLIAESGPSGPVGSLQHYCASVCLSVCLFAP